MRYYILLLYITLSYSCKAQKPTSKNQNIDEELTNIYNKYKENKYDYASKKGEARDTILNRFKNNLLDILKSEQHINSSFEKLSKEIKIITSKDKNLKIFSWDQFNGGTWHVYNSVYQYQNNEKIYSGELSFEDNSYTEIIHFKIHKVTNNKYLVEGYGTHGGGKEFFVYRLLSFQNNTIKDCEKCFNGKDQFIYEVTRGEEKTPEYNTKEKEIVFYELKPTFIDGDVNEPSGFKRATDKKLKLKFKEEDGLFYKTNY